MLSDILAAVQKRANRRVSRSSVSDNTVDGGVVLFPLSISILRLPFSGQFLTVYDGQGTVTLSTFLNKTLATLLWLSDYLNKQITNCCS